MSLFKKVVVSSLVLVVIFFLINTYPIFYFSKLKFETEEIEIVYKYKWDLLGFIDFPTDRKIIIENKTTQIKKSYRLLADIVGLNEVRFYIVDKEGSSKKILIEDGFMFALINSSDLELITLSSVETSNENQKYEKRECIGKIYRDKFMKGNCSIESY